MSPRRQKSLDPALDARRAAVQILEATLSRRGGIDDPASVSAFGGLSAQDRGFARALVMATLRYLGPIDECLGRRVKRRPPDRVVTLLRLGLAQILAMDVPDFAAVDCQVSLAAESTPTRPFKGLINATLRSVLRDGTVDIADESFVPAWMLARWTSQFGAQQAGQISAQVRQEPRTDLTLLNFADFDHLQAELEGQGVCGLTLRVGREGNVPDWPGFADGRWWVQDVSASLPARLFDFSDGLTALDMCAAPGGKTLQLASKGFATTALDRSDARLNRVRENLLRTGLTAQIHASPAESWASTETFDRVLLDAPCSATGTFRRHPDVLWTARPADITKLSAVQARLLDAARSRVKPGGQLIYCVCSLESEEGEAQVQSVLKRHPDLVLEPILPGEADVPAPSRSPEGWVRLLPHHVAGGADGFFIARFRKT
jgi:16S rRNA (cytosine967-C5)-methyltransferase